MLAGHDLVDVELTGPLTREQVAVQMSRASVMAFPTTQDGFGMVQAEALACGCPVITTTSSGAEDLFADGEEGFIVPPRDPEAIAQALLQIYHEPDLAHHMSVAARLRVERLGGWDQYGTRIIALFRALTTGQHDGSDFAV